MLYSLSIFLLHAKFLFSQAYAQRTCTSRAREYYVPVMRCPRSVLARLVKFWMAIEGEVTDNFLQLFSRFLIFMIRLHLFVGKLAGPLKCLFLVASVRKQLQIKRQYLCYVTDINIIEIN